MPYGGESGGWRVTATLTKGPRWPGEQGGGPLGCMRLICREASQMHAIKIEGRGGKRISVHVIVLKLLGCQIVMGH